MRLRVTLSTLMPISNMITLFLHKCLAVALLAVFSVSANAKNTPELLSSACGPPGKTFSVTRTAINPSLAIAPQNRARLIVFIDTVGLGASCNYSPRIGIDGTWAGAACGGSYLSVTIAPGKHMVCASGSKKLFSKYTALAGLTAQADKVYYLRERIIFTATPVISTVATYLEPIDPYQGQLLLSLRKRSISHPR
jgi:hypothetical protein